MTPDATASPTLASREVELKSVVDDLVLRRRLVEGAGGSLLFEGRLEDRRYDSPDRSLAKRDHVLRLRVHRDETGARGALDWKGPTSYEAGYKVRDELTTPLGDPDAAAAMLERLGYVVTREIDRVIAQYRLHDAIVRFERYPRMDPLVEVEGAPDAIERAITALGLPREGFTAERLPQFVARYERRTGERAAICDRELRGDYPFAPDDA
jgi:adenylate cyclase class 2